MSFYQTLKDQSKLMHLMMGSLPSLLNQKDINGMFASIRRVNTIAREESYRQPGTIAMTRMATGRMI